MTQRSDVADGRGIGLELGARWRVLAERRLEYLTELFESGRWRRFYSERAFLENIQEAKAAVAHWRDLSRREVVHEPRSNGEVAVVAQAAPIIVEPKVAAALVVATSDAVSDEMLPVAATRAPDEPIGESAMTQERYALLRNML